MGQDWLRGVEEAHISGTHDTSDLLHGVEVGTQTTVHGEDLLVNDGSNGQAVEAIGEGLPQLDVVPSLTFVVETVDTVDRGAFVVTAEDEKVLWVLDLVGEQQANGLEGLLSTVDIVSEEKVVGFWGETAVLEQTEEVVVLSMDITADLPKVNLSSKGESC